MQSCNFFRISNKVGGCISWRMFKNPINSNKNISNVRFTSSYQVEEVLIPVPSVKGHLAGKLWKGPKTSNSKHSMPIICLHGTQDNCGTFDPLIPLILKDDMTIFALDFAGHGHSYHTEGLFYDHYLDGMFAIKTVLKHFEWEKVTLLGHSLGSVISYIYSGCFPEQVHRYIGIDSFRPVPQPDVTKTFQRIVKTLVDVHNKLATGKERPSYTYDDMLKKVMIGRQNSATLEGNRILLKRGAELIEGTDRYRFTHDLKTTIPNPFRFLSAHQTDEIGKNITCPVCIIKGEPGEDYEPRENFLQAIDLVSKSSERLEFHLVPGTHHVHLNEPHLVSPIINKFLES